MKFLPAKTVYRIEDKSKLMGFVQQVPQGESITFAPFEIVHFKLATTVSAFNPYGTSVLESSRRAWRQLKLMEDAMVVYRVTRAPERRVFKIPVGRLPTAAAEQLLERQRHKFRKKNLVNSRTGDIDWRANSMAPDEDFFVASYADGTATEIDTLPGADNLGEVDDVKYFKGKIFAALKIPRIYLQDEEIGTDSTRQNLSQQDIRFSRTIERVQSHIIEGLKKIAIVHLMLRGYKKKDLSDFDILLTPPSSVREQLENELMESTSRAASEMYDFGFSKLFVAQKFFGVSKEEWIEEYQLHQKEEMGEDPYAQPMNPNVVSNPYDDDDEQVFANLNPGDDGDFYQSSDDILNKDDEDGNQKFEARDNPYIKLLAEGDLQFIGADMSEIKTNDKVLKEKYLSENKEEE
jgi:hypothetical protein